MEHNYITNLKLGFLVLIFYTLTPVLHAQTTGELIPFTQTYPLVGDSPVIRGDLRVIGNSILGFEESFNNGFSINRNDDYNGTAANNQRLRAYIDIDSDSSFDQQFVRALPISETKYSDALNGFGSPFNSPNASTTGTFSSSMADLDLFNPSNSSSSTSQNCSKVVKAFLYWGAIYTAESQERGIGTRDEITIARPDCNGCEHYTDIKILPPGATEYIDIKESNSGNDYTLANADNSLQTRVLFDGDQTSDNYTLPDLRSIQDSPYVCVADVTSLFTYLQDADEIVEGNWTVANVRATTGYKNTGSGGGWSLVVVYEDPLANAQKNITLFEGFVLITGDQNLNPVEFNITGFETIPAGPVNVDIATIGLEGDSPFIGDAFEINVPNPDGSKSNDWEGLTYNGQDANNFYDSSIYSKGDIIRFPNSSNTLGYDSDHFTIDNLNNQYIGNSDNAADFRLFTNGDTFSNFFTSFAIEVIAPELEVIKRAFRPDNSEFTSQDEVNLGDDILYKITITNAGNDNAVDISLVDILPINTSYDTINITLDGNLISENDVTSIDTTATDDITGLTFDTKQISFDIDDDLLEVGESVEITFTVSVVDDCELLQDICTNRIQNQVDVSYSGLVDVANSSVPVVYVVQSAFEIDECEDADPGPTVLLSEQSFCETVTREITQCAENVALEGGIGFVEYQWFFEGVRITKNADGTDIGLADNIIFVADTGNYSVEQFKSVDDSFISCRDVQINFDVVIFDPFDPPNNPFEDLGEILDPVCSVDGTEITEILLCNEEIEITTDFPDNTTYSWQMFDENSGCTSGGQNCPYLIECYTEVGNEENFVLSQEGSYVLTIVLFDGGCEFNYYFDAVPIDIDPKLTVPQILCEDEAVFTVTGVDLSRGNAVDFELVFEVTNQGVTQTFPAEDNGTGIFNSITLPRVAGEGYTIQGVVTPTNIGEDDLCSFNTGTPQFFEFIDLTAELTVLTQPTCSIDPDPTDNFDPRVADISLEAASGFAAYVFDLINITGGANTLVSSSGTVDDNNFRFFNLDPASTYEVEIYAFGTDSTTADNANCSFTLPITGIDIPLDFDVTVGVAKALTCDPAEISVDVSLISQGTTTDPNPEFTYVIEEIPGNIYTGSQIIRIDDISNIPGNVNEIVGVVIDANSVSFKADDGVIINYIDLSNIAGTEFTIIVTSPESSSCNIEEVVTIFPYDAPTTKVNDIKNIDCNGDNTGSITVSGLLTSGGALVGESYEIIAGPELRTAQNSPVFSNLPAGDYTIQVTDAVGCTATVNQPLTEPDLLVAPVIENTAFTCESDAIISITTGTQNGIIDYSYELFRNGSLYRDLGNTAIDMATANSVLATENLTEGVYTLVVIDDSNCTEVVSNELTIEALPAITIVEVSHEDDFECASSTDEPLQELVLSATLDTTDTIEGYRISGTSNPSFVTTSTSFTTIADPTNIVLNLPEGTHTIEVRSTATLCTETFDIIVGPYTEVTLDTPVTTGVTCFGGADGSIEFTVNDFDTTLGFSYDLTFESVSVASSAQETTATIPITGLVASNTTGDYELTITDLRGDGCSDPIVQSLTILGPTEPVINGITADYDCENNNYIIRIDASEGTGTGYTFTTDSPATTQTDLVFTLPAPTTDTTVNVSIEDSINCAGQDFSILLEAVPVLTADIVDTNLLCLATGSTPIVTVDVTSGEGSITYQLLGTTNIQNSTVTDSGQFIIANPEIAPGTYTYEIFDDNHTLSTCATTVTYTINELLSIDGIVINQEDCSTTTPLGSLPTNGASISFNINGGSIANTGAYSYTFDPVSARVVNTGTTNNPIFVFDNSFEGTTINIEVTDDDACTAVEVPSVTIDYPDVFSVALNVPVISCAGETTILTLDPGDAGTADDGNYEYSFDGGLTYVSSSGQPVFAGTTNYAVRNIVTQCVTEGSINITEPDLIIVLNEDAQPVTCSTLGGDIPGSYEITVQGGVGPYTYDLYSNDDLSTILDTKTPALSTDSAVFSLLDSGSYTVVVTDQNLCISQLPITFEIIPTPDGGVSDISVTTDCTNRATLFFEIIDGSGDGEDFFVSPTLLGTPVDPSIPGDDIYQIGDADYTALIALVGVPITFTPTIAGSTNGKVYAVTNIDFDVVDDFITVLDNTSNCTYSKEYSTPTSDEVSVIAEGINAGACDLNSGAVNITYSTVTAGNVVVEIFRVSDGLSVSTPITLASTSAPQTEQITGLPVGSLRVRVQQEAPLQCNATTEFEISVGPALEGPEFLGSSPANCNGPAQLELIGSGGTTPYTYAVAMPGLLIADGEALADSEFTFTTGSIDFSTIISDTSIVDGNGNVTATVFVRDFSGCTSGPYDVDIPAFPSPDVDFSLVSSDECSETGPFVFDYEIVNYDATQIYTLTVDGGVAQVLPTSATGTYEVTTRGDHEVVIFGDAYEFCTVTTTVNIPDIFVVEANLSEPDCDGNITELVVDVTGGYDPIAAVNRQLTYVVSEGGIIRGTINSTNTTETFTSVTGALGTYQLLADVNYTISVTDTYDSTVPTGTERICLKSDTDTKTSLAKPTLELPTITDLSCIDAADGTAQINIAAGYTGTVAYELYRFGSTVPLPAVIDENNYQSIITANLGTLETASLSVSGLYEGLEGTSDAQYLPVVLTTGTTLSCPVVGAVFTITEPPVFIADGITAVEDPGTCEPFKNPTIVIDDSDIVTPDGTLPYSYRIVGLVNTFTEITSFPLEVEANDGTFDVEITDASECSIITIPVTLSEVKSPLATITSDDAFSCNTPEEIITVTVTNGAGTESYTITNIQFTDADGTVSTPTTAPVTPGAGIFDAPFTLTEPGLYVFEYSNDATGCTGTVAHTIEELDQLQLDAADAEILCNGGSTTISFEVSDYEGDFNYEVQNSVSTVTATGTVIDFGTATPSISTQTGAVASIDVVTGTITLDAILAEMYTINITTIETTTTTASVNPLCTASIDVEVIEPDPLTVGITTVIEPLSCINGTAILQTGAVTGGTAAYSYELVESSRGVIATNSIGVFDTGIIAGDYLIRVSDAEPTCSSVDSAIITITDPVEPILEAVSGMIGCEGDSTTITATVSNIGLISGTVTSLRYSLFIFDAANPNGEGTPIMTAQTSNIFNNVSANITGEEYLVKVTDDLGCLATITIPSITEPDTIEFLDPELTRGLSCDITTQGYTLSATGGTPDGSGNYKYQQYNDFISEGGLPIGVAITGVTATFNGNDQLFFRVTDENGCDDFITFTAASVPSNLEFEIEYTEATLCFGEPGGVVNIMPGTSISGGVGSREINLYVSTNPTVPLSNITTPAVTRIGTSTFTDLVAEDPSGVPYVYIYEVTSGSGTAVICEKTETFSLSQHDELLVDDFENPVIGCADDDDAILRIKVTDGTGIGRFVYSLKKEGEDSVFITEDAGIEAVFEFLSPCADGTSECYTYSIVSDNGTGCTGPSGTFNIAPKDPLSVSLDRTLSMDPLCEGDTNGTRFYNVSGATAPYYFVLLDNPDDEDPIADDIVGNNTYLVENSNTILNPNLIELSNLETDITYKLFVFDSGNGLIGQDLLICDPFEFEFDFESQNLGLIEEIFSPNCSTLDYTVGIVNLNPEIDDDDLTIQLFERNADGSDGTAVGTTVNGDTLTLENVVSGTYNAYVESTVGCTTALPERIELELPEFSPVEFVVTGTNGEEIQPFIVTNELNVYQLQATGGVNSTGINSYTFEGTFSDINGGISSGVIEVDNNGFFTIEETGFYTFRVIDNFGDNGVTCFDESRTIGINSIDIDIPNVFNPSSSFFETSTWFPENITSDFGGGLSPIIDEEGDGEPQISGIVTTTDSVVVGGSITSGTTTGGVTTGGTVTSGSIPTVITGSTVGSDTITSVTTGGTTNGSGVTTGGITITTTVNGNSGNVTVQITTGGTITGGTTDSNGIVTGGTITGGTTQEAVITSSDASGVTYVITTSGTTTGGITEGGTTTGGITTFTNSSTVDEVTGSFITTDGITTGATTTGGTTTGGTTTVISVPTSGGSAIVEVTTGTTIINGTTTNGTTTGGITTGGTVTEGASNVLGPFEFLDYENMEVFVFDRYGRLLKDFTGIKLKGEFNEGGWDGTYQGKEMPSGDYWYLIKLNDNEGREFTGHFTLYRR